jgi:hypothetical protein
MGGYHTLPRFCLLVSQYHVHFRIHFFIPTPVLHQNSALLLQTQSDSVILPYSLTITSLPK